MVKVHSIRKRYIFLVTVALSLIVLASYQIFFAERIATVVKGRIYRSAQLSSRGLQKIIEEEGIRTIINLRGGFKGSEWYVKEQGIAERNNVRLYDIMLSPHNLPEYSALQSILDALSRSERPILIHCRRGVDRTGMVSALALAIEQDAPFAELKKQFSWRYGVFPFYRSIGPYFFSRYEQWLEKTHRDHNRDNLKHWVRNEYLDDQGNLRYWIDQINGEVLKERKAKVMITGDPKNIVIEGWAFDSSSRGPAVGLSVAIDNKVSTRVAFRYNRPDVAKHFSLGEEYYEQFPVGWRAEFDTDLMGKGCHNVSLKLVTKGSETLEIPSGHEVCF